MPVWDEEKDQPLETVTRIDVDVDFDLYKSLVMKMNQISFVIGTYVRPAQKV